MRITAVLFCFLFCNCLSLSAGIWFENPPAGRLPATAQTTYGVGALDGISGNLDELTEVDLFWISITDPLAFSATTFDDPGFTIPDPRLFLFDALGYGVYANDDAVGSQSELPAGHPLGPKSVGIYLLGISRFANDPLSISGPIFTQNAGVNGPDPLAGGLDPLTAWDDNVIGRVDVETEYFITLTGAEFVPVPEPGTAVLVFAGLLFAARWRSKQRRPAE